MDSIIEIQRQTHEQIERFERALYVLLSRPDNVHETRLQNEHKSAQALDGIMTRVDALHAMYEDTDTRKAELEAISAPPTAGPDELKEFYSRLVKIQEHYNKYPDSAPGGFDLEIAALLDEPGQDDEEEYEEDRELPDAFPEFVLNVCSYRSSLFWRRSIWEIRRLVCQPCCVYQPEKYRQTPGVHPIP